MTPSPQASRPRSVRARDNSRLWRPDLRVSTGPVYRAIVDALEADVAAGRLTSGARLPSQRVLARALGVNLTTVTRAMGEAERRGLVIGSTGSGTFVASRVDRVPDWLNPSHAEARADFVDLSLNYPPDIAEAELARALADWAADIARRPQQCRSLLPYRATQGAASDRVAGALWLEERGLAADPSRIMISNGAQHGLALSLATLVRPGEAVLCEALAYPGLRSVAAIAGIRLIPLATDSEGLRPAALREAIRRYAPRALVCTPTLQNPTAAVASLARRQELVRILKRTGLWVIEDDLYGALATDAPPSIAMLLPERTIYVTSLSKTVAPGLRVGYVVAPSAAVLDGLLGALRASSWMTAPVLAAIASTWIREGIAQRALRHVRRELVRRQRIVRKALPTLGDGSHATRETRAPHQWVPLKDASAEAHTVALLNRHGVGVMAGEAFRVGTPTSYGFRICLGAARSAEDLAEALRVVNDVLTRGDSDGNSWQ